MRYLRPPLLPLVIQNVFFFSFLKPPFLQKKALCACIFRIFETPPPPGDSECFLHLTPHPTLPLAGAPHLFMVPKLLIILANSILMDIMG